MPSRPTPPPQLVEVATKVDARLQAVLDHQSSSWGAVDPRLAEAVDELGRMVTSGGKRLRAAFCYWAWRGYYGEAMAEDLVIDMGAAFEFLQVFALIHDDIMDGSSTRRGATTVHVRNAERLTKLGWRGEARRFGDGVGILVGDLGHVYADQLTAGISPRARQLWDELRIELNLGQYLDMRSAAAGDLDHATAQQVATFKTALYTIVRPLQIGVCLHGAPDPDVLERLDRFGRPLGQAFQLRDDALGLLSDEVSLGKPVGDDLREGKPTGILAYARRHASESQQQVLSKVGCAGLDATDIDDIVSVIGETGALEDNEHQIDALVGESRSMLEQLPLQAVGTTALATLADYVATRTF